MASIEKRGANSWRIGVRNPAVAGRPWVRRTLRFPADMPDHEQERQAAIAHAQLVLEVESGVLHFPENDPGADRPTVNDLAKTWMNDHVLPNLAEKTAHDYRHFLDTRILPALGGVYLDELTPLMVSRFLASLRKAPRIPQRLPDDQLKRPRDKTDTAKMSKQQGKPLSANTIRHYHDTLQYMLSKAVQWDLLPYNPMDKVDRPKVRKYRPKFLDDDQAIDIIRKLMLEPMHVRASVLLALVCGLRLGEVGALRFTDVNWKAKTIDISRARKYTPDAGTYEDVPKSEDSERIITVPDLLMDTLKEIYQYQQAMRLQIPDHWHDGGYIVCNWNGAPFHPGTPSKQFKSFLKRHNLQHIRYHDLRHSHATLLIANNIDIMAVANRLGHSDPSFTLRTYGHAIRRRDRESADAMQLILLKAQDPTEEPEEPTLDET